MTTLISEKLITINNIKLPMDLINIIKSYTYYDINSLGYIKYLSKKNPNLEKIKSAISRNNNQNYFDDNDSNESWLFGFVDGIETLQFQCINCAKCGNYKDLSELNHFLYIIYKKIPIMCLCIDNEYLDEYEGYLQND
jgi:hypothetical protein